MINDTYYTQGLKIYTAFLILLLFISSTQLSAADENLIFPIPQELTFLDDTITIDEDTRIVVPLNATTHDIYLAKFLVREMSDTYGLALGIDYAQKLPNAKNKLILMGTTSNPLINRYCIENNIKVTPENPGPEGYVLTINKKVIVIAGSDEQGAFYGLQSLRQVIEQKNKLVYAPGLHVRDWPRMKFRAIRMYIPGPENIPFFKRFLQDFMALYKYNKVILEVNCMRLDNHPEVNAGWIEFSRFMNYTRSSEMLGPRGETKNSGHQDAGDGYIIEKDDVKRLVDFASQNFIEVIPEIPSLAHGYYLLTRHPELAEYQGDLWPDTYCPSNPKSYELMFDVFDEYIEVIKPQLIHIGHDEWRGAPLNICKLCEGKDYAELYAQDVNKIHHYLTEKGIKTFMWGDHLLESVRGKGPHNRTTESGIKYQTPGALPSSVVLNSIPKDIIIFNWFWKDQKRDKELDEFGFQQVYGNFKPNISDWDARIKNVDVLGGAPSSWTATNEFNIGKDLILDFLGCANLLWSTHTLDQGKLGDIVRNMTQEVRTKLSGKYPPSNDGGPVTNINIVNQFNLSSNSNELNININSLITGEVSIGNISFELMKSNSGNSAIAIGAQGVGENPLPSDINVVEINEDVSSLIFLHACAKPAGNQKSYFSIFNTFDSSDLLGWYQVTYEDGYIEIIPIQYGVNILEWNPGGEKSYDAHEGDTGSPQKAYCYAADAINCSSDPQNNPITFYAFEWRNTRFGKKIKAISISGSVNYESLQPEYSHAVTEPMHSNAIMLIGLSKVIKKPLD